MGCLLTSPLSQDEMTPLKSSSTEFLELKNYLVETRGSTHNANYHVDQIFRIERQGEKDRFEKSPFAGPPRDRRLLWHGSRCTNFGGILSQGLRIAPPEAPVNGYMFGKGIYLADMSKGHHLSVLHPLHIITPQNSFPLQFCLENVRK
jgi:poly [ADP-ribose] polymerase